MVRARLSPQIGSIPSAKDFSAVVQARFLATGAGAGWGVDMLMSSPACNAPSSRAAAAAAGFLPLPIGRPTGRHALAATRCTCNAPNTRLPLGLHLALDLSPIDLRRRALFDPLHAELEEAPLPGLAVRRIGNFRPFPNDLRARSRISKLRKILCFFLFGII
jgi:hypothetical protein